MTDMNGITDWLRWSRAALVETAALMAAAALVVAAARDYLADAEVLA